MQTKIFFEFAIVVSTSSLTGPVVVQWDEQQQEWVDADRVCRIPGHWMPILSVPPEAK